MTRLPSVLLYVPVWKRRGPGSPAGFTSRFLVSLTPH